MEPEDDEDLLSLPALNVLLWFYLVLTRKQEHVYDHIYVSTAAAEVLIINIDSLNWYPACLKYSSESSFQISFQIMVL